MNSTETMTHKINPDRIQNINVKKKKSARFPEDNRKYFLNRPPNAQTTIDKFGSIKMKTFCAIFFCKWEVSYNSYTYKVKRAEGGQGEAETGKRQEQEVCRTEKEPQMSINMKRWSTP